MEDEGTVMIQALTTYMEGAEHKNERSAPYRVPRAHAVDLTANGFARIVTEESAGRAERPEDGATDHGAADDPEAAIDNDGKPRGRRGGPRG